MTATENRAQKTEKRLATAMRAKRSLELRLAGYTYAEVAEQLGYKSVASAYYAARRALQAYAQPLADEARAVEAARLERLQRPFWRAALEGDRLACDRVLSIMARRAALLGLDAPLQVDLRQHLLRYARDERHMEEDEAVAAVEAYLRERQR